MAKIAEQFAILKISKLVKNNDSTVLEVLDEELLQNITALVQELLGSDSIVVELELGN